MIELIPDKWYTPSAGEEIKINGEPFEVKSVGYDPEKRFTFFALGL